MLYYQNLIQESNIVFLKLKVPKLIQLLHCGKLEMSIQFCLKTNYQNISHQTNNFTDKMS